MRAFVFGRRRRGVRRLTVVAIGVVGVLLSSQLLGAQAAETSQVGVVVTRLDAAGFPTQVTLNQFTRTYEANGSKDDAKASQLSLQNGLAKTGDGLRALPVVIRTHYFLDGQEVTPKEISGKSGAFRIEWDVMNRTQRTEDVTFTDSNTGEQTTITAATFVPFTVELTGLELPDGTFDSLTSNGVLSRNDANNASTASWTSVLAPPVFPGSATFSLEGKINAFKLGGSTLTATPGVGGALPASAQDAGEKGGSTAATLRGYVSKFGDGFGQLGGGLTQIKGGVDSIFAGINGQLKPGLKAPNFDAAKFAEDSTLADNQPGLMQGLQILSDGLGQLVNGAAQMRAGLKTGDPAKPGVKEGLDQIVAGIGNGTEFDGSGNPLSIRATLNALRMGVESGDVNAPGLVEGLQKIIASIGTGTEFNGATPLTMRASLNAVRAGLSSGNPANPKIIEGLSQIFDSIGTGTEFNGTAPLTVAAGLAAIRGGLQSGDLNNPAVIEGLQTIYASIGNGTEFAGSTPLSVAASLAAVRAALSTGNPAAPGILEGLQQIYAGIGNGTEFDGTGKPLTAMASLKAIRAGLSSGNPADPKIIEAITQVVGGLTLLSSQLGTFDTTFIANVNNQLGLLAALPIVDPVLIAVLQGVVHSGVTQAQGALGLMKAGLSSGDPLNPAALEGLQQIYASIGNGSEFSGATPLTLAASMVAMRAGLSSGDANNPKIIEGLSKIYASIGTGSEFSGSTPLTIRAALTAMRAGLSSGDVNSPKIIEGLQQIFNSIGTASGTGTLANALQQIRDGLKSGNPADPKIIEGLQTIYASIGNGSEFSGTTPLSIQAGMVALQQGAAQLAGGAQLVHDSIGDGTEFGPDGSPLSAQAAVAALGAGAAKLGAGIAQLVTGLGDVDANGVPVKAVTTRVSKYGNTIESPSSLLWGLESSKDAVSTKFVAGVTQILDALGDPNVSSQTILFGLKQLSEGLGTAAGGTTTGAAGAAQVAHVLSRTVADQDVTSALHQAGLSRAEHFIGFNDGAGEHQRSVFVFRLGGVA